MPFRLAFQAIVMLCLLLCTNARAEDWRISVITFGPGPSVEERFGHIAIRVQNPARQLDRCYDWGNFDFEEPNFIGKFVKGSLLYWMDASNATPMIEFYSRRADRTTTEQVLNLSDTQTQRLLAEIDRQAHDPKYLYDYFLDNCSTRVRDVLDIATDGAIRAQLADTTPHSFRWHERRLMQVGAINRVLSVLIDFSFGPRTDRQITRWEACFLPTILADELDTIHITDDAGQHVALVKDRQTLNQTTTPGNAEPNSPPNLLWITLPVGLLAAGSLLAAARWCRPVFIVLASGWELFVLFGAIFMPTTILFTRHWVVAWNENMLQFTPLALIVLAGLWVRRWRRALAWSAFAAAGLSAFGAIITISHLTHQPNAPSVAIALPLHLAVLVGLRYLNRRSALSEEST